MGKKVIVSKGKARVASKNTPAPAPVTEAPEPRQFTDSEVLELQELHRLVGHKEFEARQVRGNSLLIPNGAEYADQIEAVARLLANTKKHWIAQKLAECGWPTTQRVSIDMKTGVIVPEGVVVKGKK